MALSQNCLDAQSLMTKLFDTYQFFSCSVRVPGAMFSAYEMVIALMQLIGAVLFNTVYQATLSLSFQGLVFLLCAVLILIPFVLVR